MSRVNPEHCKHEQSLAYVNVRRMEIPVGTFVAQISVKCALCETPFEFLPLSPQHARVAGEEARLTMVAKGPRQ